MPFSKARSLWCCIDSCTPGPVQEVKKVEVIEQAVSLVLAEELIHFPTVYSCIWYQLCFICSSRSRDTVPQSISLELAVKTTCHFHFGQHGLSRFISVHVIKFHIPPSSISARSAWFMHSCSDTPVQTKFIGANHPGFGGSVPCPARIMLFTWNVRIFKVAAPEA